MVFQKDSNIGAFGNDKCPRCFQPIACKRQATDGGPVKVDGHVHCTALSVREDRSVGGGWSVLEREGSIEGDDDTTALCVDNVGSDIEDWAYVEREDTVVCGSTQSGKEVAVVDRDVGGSDSISRSSVSSDDDDYSGDMYGYDVNLSDIDDDEEVPPLRKRRPRFGSDDLSNGFDIGVDGIDDCSECDMKYEVSFEQEKVSVHVDETAWNTIVLEDADDSDVSIDSTLR